MSRLKKQGDLTRQIPLDVKERIRKAGVEEVDWYAGRLTSESRGFTEVPPAEHQQLKDAALNRRRARRKEKRDAGVTTIRALVSSLWPRRARHAR
jgi:hypothetical protein